jgi:hypothetical protein
MVLHEIDKADFPEVNVNNSSREHKLIRRAAELPSLRRLVAYSALLVCQPAEVARQTLEHVLRHNVAKIDLTDDTILLRYAC